MKRTKRGSFGSHEDTKMARLGQGPFSTHHGPRGDTSACDINRPMTSPITFVIASAARQSRVGNAAPGLPRRFAPRNDDSGDGAVGMKAKSAAQGDIFVSSCEIIRRCFWSGV
jgi:hypothetical protein